MGETRVTKVRLRRVGERVEAELPTELVARYGLEPGTEILAMDADGGIYLAPRESAFHRAFRNYEDLGRRYHRTIEDLSR